MNIAIKLTAVLAFSVSALTTFGQDYKTLKEINNALVDRKDEWVAAKKLDMGLMSAPKGVSFSLSGTGITINNSKNNNSIGFDNPTNKKYEQECWEYVNGKFSIGIKTLAGDQASFAGLNIKRRADISTIRSNWGKTIDGKMDYQERTFKFLINGNGDVKILANRKTDEELFKASAVKGFIPADVNKISIEKKTLTWNFYLNDNLVYTYEDNSYGGISSIDFTIGAGTKIILEPISYTYYDNPLAPYERQIAGSTVYKDNECGIKILEGNIDKLCPTAEFNNINVRYASSYCEAQKNDFSYYILFFKRGAKAENALSEFMTTYLKDLYGAEYNEDEFKAKKNVAEKDNEATLVEQIKKSFTDVNKNISNVQFSALNDMTVGNNSGRYFDVSFELDGNQRMERKFYSYTPRGLMIIKFVAPQGKLETNTEYKQVIKNVYSF